MPLENQIEDLIATLKEATDALKENTAVGRQVLANAGRAAENDGIPAFAKEAKQNAPSASGGNTEAVSEVTNIADAPKKRGPKPKAAAPEPNVYDKLCVAVTQLVDSNQTDKIMKVFDKFGVKKASHLAPEHHQEAYDLLSGESNEPAAVASFV